MADKENIHSGHRRRMREKFFTYGDKVFNTYELLEMLLYHVIPYKNTNPTAKLLIKELSDIEGVLSASPESLMTVDGVGKKTAELITAAGRLFSSDGEGSVTEGSKPISSPMTHESMGEYFVNMLSDSEEPEVAVALLNNKREIIHSEILYKADFSSAKIKPDAFVALALSKGASAVVVAHSHPFGPLYPTISDVATTRLVRDGLSGIGVELSEHYVISGRVYFGISDKLNMSFYQNSLLEREADEI